MLATMRLPVRLLVLTLLWGCPTRPEPVRRVDAAAPALAPPAPVDAGPPPAPKPPPGPPKRIFAKKFVVKVREAPRKDAFRIGYMRMGAVLTARTGEPVGHDRCRKGWYELETGGFVCSTVDAIPFLGTRLPERRPQQPDRKARLPYPYGYSRRKNTPVFRRLPTDEEAAEFEGYRIPGLRVASPDGGLAMPDAGVAVAPQAAGAPGAGVVAALPVPDAGQVTLASLMGAQDSVLMRRMERGFYVSLDRDMKKGRRRYWRTQSNGFIPHKRLLLVKGTEFSGVLLGGEDGLQLPIGYLLSSKHFAYRVDDRGRIRRAGKPGYHHSFRIASETEIRSRRYYAAVDGMHYRVDDTARIAQREKPEEVREEEKWIDVDLSSQSLVAYEGATPVFATLISSGRVKDEEDPLKNFATPTGSFRITSKHLTATMDGDHAVDGPYSIEDVPYVMYFQLAYAIHSAFWHNSFGRPRSHGCINMPPEDARWLFDWATPLVPHGWHGAYPTEQALGTRLYIRGEAPQG